MRRDPLEIDGLGAIWVFTILWAVALIAQYAGVIDWNRNLLSYGVAIGVLIISFLTHRRYRRRHR